MTMARRSHVGGDLPAGVDVFLVTKLVNVRYLTGFLGSNAAVLVWRDGTAMLATDGRYEIQAGEEVPDVPLLVTRSLATDLVREARAKGGADVIGIEGHAITLDLHGRLVEAAAGAELRDVGQLVEARRVVKDDIELAALQRACEVTDDVFDRIVATLRIGQTEREVAWSMHVAMREFGAEGPAFDSIVAFGAHSAIPHHQPTDRALQVGDLVKLDFGALVDGYHADMTRTVIAGVPAPWQKDLHGFVEQLQSDLRSMVRPGAIPVDIDDASRVAIDKAGYSIAHGLGHGVGLEIHEAPFLVPGSTAPALVADTACTVEPGVYLAGRGGVRVEDTVVVTADGVRELTRSARELLVVAE